MVDLIQLSISQWLLVFRQRYVRVSLDIEVEDMVAKCLGRAEGGKEEGCAERLTRGEELDW